MKKICPTCKRQYTEIENYCTKCGIELIKVPNRCAEKKTAACRNKIFAGNDLYCSFCGSPTEYAADMLKERVEMMSTSSLYDTLIRLW